MALDIDRYAHLESPLQRWDPRLKIAALGLFILVTALLQTIPMAMVALICGAALLGLSGLPLRFISHGLSFVLVFLLPFFIIMPFSYPGEPAFHWLGLGFAWEGLRLASLIFLKALAIVMMTFTLFGSSRFDISMLALQHLRCPRVVVQMLLFTYRYTYVFLGEMRRMHTSMRARGFIARMDPATLRVYGHFVGTLLVRSFERTERVYKAMLAKGYQGELHSLVTFRAEAADYLKALVVLAGGVVLLYADRAGPWRVAAQGWY